MYIHICIYIERERTHKFVLGVALGPFGNGLGPGRPIPCCSINAIPMAALCKMQKGLIADAYA